MFFAAGASRRTDAAGAVSEAVDRVRDRWTPPAAAPDLAFVFFTGHHADDAGEIARQVRESLRPGVLLGCTAESVLGDGDEIEREPGVSLLAGALPGVTLAPFFVPLEDWTQLLRDEGSLARRIGIGAVESGPEPRAVLALADPFTTPQGELLDTLHRDLPGVPLLGGQASGATQPGGNRLLLDDEVLYDGVVGVGVAGPVRVEAVVSQGCRPVGPPLRVTGARGTAIETLRMRPALEMAETVLSDLPPEEQALLENGLYVGVVIDEYRERFDRGDFLVRNLIGAYADEGSLAIADEVRAGQTIQFHLRDARTAEEDLRLLLRRRSTEAGGRPPAGALLFSCNGRGTRLFDAPGHDVGAIEDAFPGLPAAGFFAAGEFGPVGGKSFLHGHTASIALFYPA